MDEADGKNVKQQKPAMINITWTGMQSFFELVINYLNDVSQEKNIFAPLI